MMMMMMMITGEWLKSASLEKSKSHLKRLLWWVCLSVRPSVCLSVCLCPFLSQSIFWYIDVSVGRHYELNTTRHVTDDVTNSVTNEKTKHIQPATYRWQVELGGDTYNCYLKPLPNSDYDYINVKCSQLWLHYNHDYSNVILTKHYNAILIIIKIMP